MKSSRMLLACVLAVLVSPGTRADAPDFLAVPADFVASQFDSLADGIETARFTGFERAGNRLEQLPTMSQISDAIGQTARESVASGCVDHCEPTWYVSFSRGETWLSGDSFGFNTVGGFFNFLQDNDDNYTLGGAIGRRTPFTFRGRDLALRTEIQGTDYHDYRLVTGSFPGAPGPPAFTYQVDVGDVWVASTNFWIDIPIHDRVEIYTGGGFGLAGHQVSVNDTVVAGSAQDVDMMSMFGAGFNFHLTDRVVLDIGYRLTDLGTSKVPLTAGGVVPAGNYKLDLETDELLATVRIELW